MDTIFDIFDIFAPQKTAEKSKLPDLQHPDAPNQHLAELQQSTDVQHSAVQEHSRAVHWKRAEYAHSGAVCGKNTDSVIYAGKEHYGAHDEERSEGEVNADEED